MSDAYLFSPMNLPLSCFLSTGKFKRGEHRVCGPCSSLSLPENSKEVVNNLIRTCFGNEVQPLVASEGDKVNARLFYGRMNGHLRKVVKAVVL